MIVMPPEERERRIQEDKKIMAALSPVRSDSLLAVLVEAKEEIEYVMENDRRNNPLYGGCPRQVRLVQKLQAEIKKANARLDGQEGSEE